ncbi:AAA family ATPase [Bacillaceae bacterium W0354]
MVITKLDIVSFGKLRNEIVEFNEGLNYFYGPNEAGKTTIRMFITYVLFGLKLQEREQYISKYDGQLGGRIFLKIKDDEWVVERFLHLNNGKMIGYLRGEKVSDEDLETVFKGMNRYLFESVFSFQDRDLQLIREHKRDDIGKILFNLGMTGSDHIVQTEKELSKSMDELFKQKGRTQPIYLKLQELKQLSKQIKEIEQKESTHTSLHKEKEALENELQMMLEKENQLKQKQQKYQMLIQSKPSITNYQFYDDQLNQLQSVKHFPKDGIKKYDELKQKILNFKEKLSIREARINEIEKSKEKIKVKSVQENINLDQLKDTVFLAKQIENQVKENDQQIKEQSNHIKQLLDEMGLSFDIEELINLKLNVYTEEHWKRLNEQQHHCQLEKEKIEAKIKVKEEEQKKLVEQRDRIISNMPTKEEYEQYKTKENDLYKQQAMINLEQTYKNDWIERKQQLESEKRTYAVTKIILPVVFVIFLISYYLFFFNQTIADYVLVLTFLIGVIGGLFFSIRREKQISRALNNITQKFKNLKSSFDSTTMREIVSKIDQYEQHVKDVEAINLKLDYIETDLREIYAESERIEKIEEQVIDQTNLTISNYPFLEQFELFQWGNVHQSLIKAKKLAQDVTELLQKNKNLKEDLTSKERVADQFISLFTKSDESYSQPSVWDVVNQCINVEQENIQKLNEYDSWLKDLVDEIHSLKAASIPYEDELKKLITQANVADEEQFINACEKYNRFIELMNKKEEAFAQVYEVFGHDSDRIISDTYDWLQINVIYNDIENELANMSFEIDQLRQALSNKRAEINRLEADGTLSDYIHQRAVLINDIKQLAKEYAVLATAKGFIIDTKSRYQQVYLPKIINYTISFFSKITNGQYVSVMFSEEDETIFVQNNQHEWFTVKQLSEGTADQLYVSLRIAINMVFNNDYLVPFILDDAFVHFDQERKSQMLSLLEELGINQQIIYLSCDQHENINENENLNILFHSSN